MSRRVHSFALSASVVVIAAAWGLTGCGGGGGGGSEATVTPSSSLNVTLSATSNSIANKQAVTLNAVASAPAVSGSASGVTPSSTVTVAQSSWDYGDGQSGTTPSHTYAKAGTYTVTYSFTDSLGLKGQGTTKVTVKACSDAGLAAAATSPTTTNVCVQTNLGEMVFALDPIKAPISTANFMKYVNDGFYNSTVVHRVQNSSPDYWVVQAGLISVDTKGYFVKTPTYAAIKLESQNGLLNKKYTLGMARSSVADSATSQFYVNLMDTPVFDYAAGVRDGYAVFGKIIFGTAVADAMGAATTHSVGSGFDYFPTSPLTFLGMAPI